MPGFYVVNLEAMRLDPHRFDSEAAAGEAITADLPSSAIIAVERDYETGETGVEFSPAYTDATFTLHLYLHPQQALTAVDSAEVLAAEVFVAAYAAHVERGGY